MGVKRAGAMVASRATHSVTVYRMDTEELMSTMSPNLANGWMVVCVRGMAATMVVTALEMMEAPMCWIDEMVRHLRISWLVCKRNIYHIRSPISKSKRTVCFSWLGK